MSRHSLTTTQSGAQIEILMGWDRQLHGFFMVVTCLSSSDGQASGHVLYDHVDAPDPYPRHLDGDLDALGHLGLEVPAEMLGEVLHDGITNAGNKVVRHHVSGGQYCREGLVAA